ncbi:hypothetical protein EV586_10730 [Tumebacillus sp. BK434]|nr:hypothetical protein EV586_10730 [Tumebacillus sp. BK434]
MLAKMMQLLGVSSEQAVQPESYQCFEDHCSSRTPYRQFSCSSGNPYYCDVPTPNCC